MLWLKNKLDVDAEGHLTGEVREVCEQSVERRFRRDLGEEARGEDKVLWFRNGTGLQSVRGVEHSHVLVRDVSRGVV